jgi:hypothetical protein
MRTLRAGMDCVGIHRTAAKSCQETEIPQYPQEILGNPLCRVADEAQAAVFEVG